MTAQNNKEFAQNFLPFLKPKISSYLSVAYSKLTEEMCFFMPGFRKELFIGSTFYTLVPYLRGKLTVREIADKTAMSLDQVISFVLFLQKEGVLTEKNRARIKLPKIMPLPRFRNKTARKMPVVFMEKNRITVSVYHTLKKIGYTGLSFLNASSLETISKKVNSNSLIVGASSNKKINMWVNKICRGNDIRWLPYRLEIDNSRADIGPMVQNEEKGCFHCYETRVQENYLFKKNEYIFVGKKNPDTSIQIQMEDNVSEYIAYAIQKFFNEERYPGKSVYTLDYVKGTIKKNVLLPDPLCPYCKGKVPPVEIKLKERKAIYFENGLRIINADKAWNNVKKYIGHIGIITKIVSFYKQIDEKQSYKGISADPLGNNMFRLHYGKGITSTQNRGSATFEAIERYCAKYAMLNPYKREVFCSYNSIKNDAVPPSRFQMYIPYYSDDAPIQWIKSWSLTSHREWYVPRNFVYYIPIGSSGLASGNCIEEAILHALFELIERDVYMIMDLNELPMPDLDLNGLKNPHIKGLLAQLNSSPVTYRIKYIKHDLGIPAFGMYMTGKVEGQIGRSHVVCAHLNKEIALSRTITEAIQAFPKFCTTGRWLNKNTDHYQKPVKSISFGSIPDRKINSITENIKFCVELLKKNNMEVFVVNHQIPGVKCAVVRVLVAGLQPIWFKEMPYLTDRVFSVPEKLGYKRKSKEELNFGEFCGCPMLYPEK